VQSVSEEYGLYKLSINLGLEIIDAYLTKDGKLFFPSVLNISNFKGEAGVEDGNLIEMPVDSASLIAENFVNEYLMTPGTMASILEISLDHDLYKMRIDIGTGTPIDSYMTKDGKLFFSQVISVE